MMRLLLALAAVAPPWTVTTIETSTDPGPSAARIAGDRILWMVGTSTRVAPIDGSAPPQPGPPVDYVNDASGPFVVGGRVRFSDGAAALVAGRATLRQFGPIARTVPVADLDHGRAASALAFASGTIAESRHVGLAVRGRGRKDLGKPVRLSPAGTIDAVAVSVNARGAVLAAWVRDGRVEARVRRRDGMLQPVRRLAAGDGIRQLHADLGDDGRAVVAWRERTLLSKVSGDVRITVRAATSGRKGRFARARRLDRFIGDQTLWALGVQALAEPGRQLVAWTGSARIRAAFRRGTGFDTPVELEPTDAVYRRGGGLQDLVAGGGSAIAVSTRPAPWGGQAEQPFAASLVGKVFGAPEALAPEAPASFAATAAIRSGRAYVAWNRRDGFERRIELASRPEPVVR